MLTTEVIRELKGCPLSILILIALSPLPVSGEWLGRHSGYTDKPVTQALRYLQDTGRISKSRAGWVLTQENQLLLGENLLENYRKNSDNRNNSDNSLSSISTKLINLEEIKKDTTTKAQNRNNSDIELIWEALGKQGLRKNKRTECLVELEHVTVDFINKTVARLANEGRGGSGNTGLLITALEQVPNKDYDSGGGGLLRGDKVSSMVADFLGGVR